MAAFFATFRNNCQHDHRNRIIWLYRSEPELSDWPAARSAGLLLERRRPCGSMAVCNQPDKLSEKSLSAAVWTGARIQRPLWLCAEMARGRGPACN